MNRRGHEQLSSRWENTINIPFLTICTRMLSNPQPMQQNQTLMDSRSCAVHNASVWTSASAKKLLPQELFIFHSHNQSINADHLLFDVAWMRMSAHTMMHNTTIFTTSTRPQCKWTIPAVPQLAGLPIPALNQFKIQTSQHTQAELPVPLYLLDPTLTILQISFQTCIFHCKSALALSL